MAGPLRLHFLGANRQVTGSRTCLEAAGTRVLVDCGLFQERRHLGRNWEPPPIAPEHVDHLLLTHAHLDHCGLIPRFVAQGYAGRVLATPPTIDLARIVLEDSARIQVEDAAYKRRRHEREGRVGPHPEEPLYTSEEAARALEHLSIVTYGRPVTLAEGLTVSYHDAGHIVGSAMIEVAVEGRNAGPTRIVFSGDIGPTDKPLTRDPTLFAHADYVVMESTYGDADHGGGDVAEALGRVIRETVERGGNLIVPAFAIDRVQEILFILSRLSHAERIPRLTVFLDSPMALEATAIYKRHAHLLDEETQAMLKSGQHPFQFPGLHFVRTAAESRALNSIRGSCVILAGAGMCTGGRVKHHLRHNIGRSESTILFSGFQAEGTLGRQIQDGAGEVRIHGRSYPVRARIERLHGLSAHADRAGLIRWIEHFERPPRRLFLVHGEAAAAESLAAWIRAHKGWTVEIPEFGETVELG